MKRADLVIPESSDQHRAVLVTDLHLTANPQDSYRWNIFQDIKSACAEYRCGTVIIPGDLTEKKDKHPARLVNPLANNLKDLFADTTITQIIISKGNHDYVDSEAPFFEFLQHMDGIRYVTSVDYIEGVGVMLSHMGRPDEFEQAIDYASKHYGNKHPLFLHQSFKGVQADNGYVVDAGIPLSVLDRWRGPVYSGDIHTPSKHGKVVYVGAPYAIDFGDSFDRGLSIIDLPSGRLHKTVRLQYPKKDKLNIPMSELGRYLEILEGVTYIKDDMLSVDIRCMPSDAYLIPNAQDQIRAICKAKGLKLMKMVASVTKPSETDCGEIKRASLEADDSVTAASWVHNIVNKEKMDEYTLKIGLDLLSDEEEKE